MLEKKPVHLFKCGRLAILELTGLTMFLNEGPAEEILSLLLPGKHGFVKEPGG